MFTHSLYWPILTQTVHCTVLCWTLRIGNKYFHHWQWCFFVCLFVSVASSTPHTSAHSQKKNLSAAQTVFAAPQQDGLWLRVNSNPPKVHKTISPLQSALRDKWQQKRLLFPHMELNHLWMLCIALFYAAFAKTASKSICKWKLHEGASCRLWNHFATFPKGSRRKANPSPSNSRW